MTRLLIVEDDPDTRREIVEEIEARVTGVEVASSPTIAGGLELLESWRPSILLTDLGLPRTDADARSGRLEPLGGVEIILAASRLRPRPVMVVLSSADRQVAVQLLLEHPQVSDYLFKDTPWPEAAARIQRHVEDAERRLALATAAPWDLVGRSESLTRLKDEIGMVAPEDTAVLILGESGTGKEVVARQIHEWSGRSAGPFVAVNCAALSEGLVESELFGHVKGAFTGADRDRPGRLEAARSGTLFLDEVGELPPAVQTKLLRVLEDRTFERVGDDTTYAADFRLIAATNRDLEQSVQDGSFRSDLYYRLAVFPLRTSPLRERLDDLGELTAHFLSRLGTRMGRPVNRMEDDALEAMASYDWPGNVRELRNVIERLIILARGGDIGRDLVTRALGLEGAGDGFRVQVPPQAADYLKTKEQVIDAFNREFLSRALMRSGGNIQRAAEEIGYNRRNFSETLRHLGIDPVSFKSRG